MMKPRYILATLILSSLSSVRGGTLRNLAASEMEATQVTVNIPEGAATYIPLPADTHFVNAIVYNAEYDDDNIFFPVQREDRQTYIYRLQPGGKTLDLVMGPLLLEGAKDSHFSVVGAGLGPQGNLCMAATNRNRVLCVNLDEKSTLSEVEIEDPTDCTFDRKDSNIIYCAAGQMNGVFTDGKDGRVEKIQFADGGREVIVSNIIKNVEPISSLTSLPHGKLVMTQRFKTTTVDFPTPGDLQEKKLREQDERKNLFLQQREWERTYEEKSHHLQKRYPDYLQQWEEERKYGEKHPYLQKEEVRAPQGTKNSVYGGGNLPYLQKEEVRGTKNSILGGGNLPYLQKEEVRAPQGTKDSVLSPGGVSPWSSHDKIAIMTAAEVDKPGIWYNNNLLSQMDRQMGKMAKAFHTQDKPPSVLEDPKAYLPLREENHKSKTIETSTVKLLVEKMPSAKVGIDWEAQPFEGVDFGKEVDSDHKKMDVHEEVDFDGEFDFGFDLNEEEDVDEEGGVDEEDDDEEIPVMIECNFELPPPPQQPILDGRTSTAPRAHSQMAAVAHIGGKVYMIPVDHSSILVVDDGAMKAKLGI